MVAVFQLYTIYQMVRWSLPAACNDKNVSARRVVSHYIEFTTSLRFASKQIQIFSHKIKSIYVQSKLASPHLTETFSFANSCFSVFLFNMLRKKDQKHFDWFGLSEYYSCHLLVIIPLVLEVWTATRPFFFQLLLSNFIG